MPEQPVVLLCHSRHIVVIQLGVQQIPQPPDAQHPVHRRRGTHPVVGQARYLVVPPLLHGGEARPVPFRQGIVGAAGGQQNNIRLHGVYLLQTDGGTAAPVGNFFRDDGVHRPHKVDDIRLYGPGCVAGKARGAGAEEHLEPLRLRDFCGVGLGHGDSAVNELRQFLRLLLPPQNVPQRPVGRRHIIQIRFDEDGGDARLLLNGVHVLGDAVLGVAQVDNELGLGGDEGLHIQAGLAAVELAEGGQIPHLLRKIGHLCRAGAAAEPHKQVIGHRHQDHLGCGAAGCDAGDLGRDLHLPSGGVGDHPGLHPLQGVVARLLAAAANQQAQAQRQYQRYPPLSTRSLHCFSSVILICISRSPKRAPHHGGSLFYRKSILPSAPAKENSLFAKQNIIPYGGTLYA